MLRCASSFFTAAYAKYASFLMIRTPCLRPFYDAVCKWPLSRLLRVHHLIVKKKNQPLRPATTFAITDAIAGKPKSLLKTCGMKTQVRQRSSYK